VPAFHDTQSKLLIQLKKPSILYQVQPKIKKENVLHKLKSEMKIEIHHTYGGEVGMKF